ncbi:hypothetical protein [Kutzneria buriramensis]|uniref:Uncharacterized protein n=1 Tax=Kutzneria buriramensis TaxID=1045776 RepID=A0A3E0GY62_9PSEU|nr:hypothetical protein [Kutzneria buriramensis]REH30992.1 hypothetical protein BCF44_12215 [Kutzneria buriramensis]
MQPDQDITIRATLTIRARRWSADIVGRPPLQRIKADDKTIEQACQRLADAVLDALPTLPAEHRDGLELDEIAAVRVLATTSRMIAAGPGDTLTAIPVPRLPDQTCLTVPLEQNLVEGRVRVSVDPDVAVLGGLAAVGPTLAVAEHALIAAIRGKLAVPPLADLGIVSLRLLRTTAFRFPVDTTCHRSAS